MDNWIYDKGYPYNRTYGSMTCSECYGVVGYKSPTLRCWRCWDNDLKLYANDFNAIKRFHTFRLKLQRIYER